VDLSLGGPAVDEETDGNEEAEGEDEGEAVFGEAFGGVVVGGLVCSFAREWLAGDDEVSMTLGVGGGEETSVVFVSVCVMKAADGFPCCC